MFSKNHVRYFFILLLLLSTSVHGGDIQLACTGHISVVKGLEDKVGTPVVRSVSISADMSEAGVTPMGGHFLSADKAGSTKYTRIFSVTDEAYKFVKDNKEIGDLYIFHVNRITHQFSSLITWSDGATIEEIGICERVQGLL